jgi:uncharacterized protein (TIGR03435 family)
MKTLFARLLALAIILAIGFVGSGLNAQQGEAPKAAEASKTPLAFEVISVKAADPQGRGGGAIRPLPGGQTYVAQAATLRGMITLMYKVANSQLVGGPDWVNTDRWDVQAKAAQPSNIDDLHEMFQTLFADRFQLKFHREMRSATVLALVVDKPGKMKRHEGPQEFDFQMQGGGKPFESRGVRCGMPYLAWWISLRLDRPVVDRTELPGFYDFTLSFLPELPPGFTAPPDFQMPDLPNIHQALKDQLGLKLESQKGQVEFFVIDHVEKPGEN